MDKIRVDAYRTSGAGNAGSSVSGRETVCAPAYARVTFPAVAVPIITAAGMRSNEVDATPGDGRSRARTRWCHSHGGRVMEVTDDDTTGAAGRINGPGTIAGQGFAC